jgi:hypothetical protein
MLDSQTTSEATKTSLGLGTVIAVVASWERNKSILWAIIHGFLSWFYVIYYALTQGGKNAIKLVVYIILSIVMLHILVIFGFTIWHLV